MEGTIDVAWVLNKLIPTPIYGGSVTSNTQASFDAVRWEDPRDKPTWQQMLDYWEATTEDEYNGIEDDTIVGDENTGIRVSDGILQFKNKTGDWADIGKASSHQVMIAQDQRPSGEPGGTAIKGGWRTRVLNTLVANTITGASLNMSKITLPAGMYAVTGYAIASKVKEHKARVYDTTHNVELSVGSSVGTGSGKDGSDGNASHIEDVFVLTEESELELQHIVAKTNKDDGFGGAADFDSNEIYASLKLQKMGD